MNRLAKRLLISAQIVVLAACSGSGNSPDPVGTAPPPTPVECTGQCANASTFLTVADVQKIIAQAVNEAGAQNAPATIAVVDRVGNVLGVYRMNGARTQVTISSGRGVQGGLEGVSIIPSELAAISKAVTGAFLSSEGNAFSTRTASQIVQEHFNPGESGGPSGPLFGVQFSQLLCSDLINLPAPVLAGVLPPGAATTIGPKTSPLGLSADPGGFPLYKNGTPVGGIGVAADDTYGLDRNISDFDRNADEYIAWAGTFGFSAPQDRRGDRITADGKAFRFTDVEFSDLGRDPSTAPGFSGLTGGNLLSLFAFTNGATIVPGTAFGTAASGIAPATTEYAGLDAFVLVDDQGQPRYAPRSSGVAQGLTTAEVRRIVQEALTVANRARAQIRRPTNSQARVSITVVDTSGTVLALARTRDAPIFGLDVALQKARTASFMSLSTAAQQLNALPPVVYLSPTGAAQPGFSIGTTYVAPTRAFFGRPDFLGGDGAPASASGPIAISARAVGNIARPFFPDGLDGTNNGPFSKPFPAWSPFTDGLQLDLAYNQITQILTAYLTANPNPILELRPEGSNLGCTRLAPVKNGIQIFPGGVPIYRGDVLIGAIGVSGDGVDQDDMIAFLGLHNAATALNSGFGNAPPGIRADLLVPDNTRLRYVQCPQAPFLNSTEQNVCEGK